MKAKLLEVQKLENKYKELQIGQPTKASPFKKSEKVLDIESADKKVVEEINLTIKKMWEVQKEINKAAQNLKKGDVVEYLDSKDNKIKEAVVVRQGKYVNDYNDTSSFVRIKNEQYSWNQSKDSIVKK